MKDNNDESFYYPQQYLLNNRRSNRELGLDDLNQSFCELETERVGLDSLTRFNRKSLSFFNYQIFQN